MTPRSVSELVRQAIGNPGQPIPGAWRHFFEERAGVDLGQALIHCDELAATSARALGASAYTFGNHIVFGAGNFTTATAWGIWLLAHEVAHVAQEVIGNPSGTLLFVGRDSVWERCANAFANAVLSGARVQVELELCRPSPDTVLLHEGPPCPGLPDWEVTAAGPGKELWLPANLAIEAAYKDNHSNQAYFLGSDFDREPRGISLSKDQIRNP